MVQTITAMDKEMALRRLDVVNSDLRRLRRATQVLRSARARRGSLTMNLRNKQNLSNLVREGQRLDLRKKEFEALIRLETTNGDDISTQSTASTPLRKSFLESKKGKLVQVLSQTRRPFFSGRGFF